MIILKFPTVHRKLKSIAQFVFKILKKMITLEIQCVNIYFIKNVLINGNILLQNNIYRLSINIRCPNCR